MSIINKIIEAIDIMVRTILLITSALGSYIVISFGTFFFIVPHTGFGGGLIIALAGLIIAGWFVNKFWDFLIEYPTIQLH